MKDILVKQVPEGCLYYISQDKFDKEKGYWELVDNQVIGQESAEEEMTYKDLADALTKLDIPFKKNSSKASLKALLDLES